MSIVMTLGDVLSVRLNYAMEDGPDRAMNVLHYKVATQTGTPPGISTALAAVGSAMYSKWSALWAPAASDEINMSSCTVTNIFPLPRSVAVTHVPGSVVEGALAFHAIPLQDSPTLLKKSDVGNRWGQGRLFYVGIAESGQHEGYLETGTTAVLVAMAAALSDVVTVTAGAWSVNLEPVLKRGADDNPVSLTRITSGRLSDIIIKTQRRRRPGKGT